MSENRNHAVCQLAVCPLRAAPKDESEIVTQLVFGDFVTVLSHGKPWIKIKNYADGYEGWMDFKQLKMINKETFDHGIKNNQTIVGNDQLNLHGPYGQLTIFLGASLPHFHNETCQLGNDIYTLKTSLFRATREDIRQLCLVYLNAPYLWGGKSLFGVDCSGLTQNIFKAIGIQVPRDASEQVKFGDAIEWTDRQVNDIVFYTTTSKKVTHVGILVNKNEIIHAHGRVRIDKCDEKGIFNVEQGLYTHVFHSVKRWT